VLCLALLLSPAVARAMPRFAVQQGVPCSLCHANPTGGGARTAYGRGPYARQTLSGNFGTPNGGFPALDPSFDEWLALGADVRAAFNLSVPRADVPERRALPATHGFLPMQADLYLHATPSPYLDLYYDQGLFGSHEIYVRPRLGILSVKAGKFVPAYGWRLPDHTIRTREALGFGPRAKDTGLALVLDHPNVTVELGTFNGAGSDVFLDTDRLRAWVGRAEGRLSIGRVHLHLGGSGYWNLAGRAGSRTEMIRAGLFGGVGLGRLAWLFEGDAAVDDQAGARTTSTAAFQELSLVVLRGLQVGFVYDFRDPDTDVHGDAVHRFGLDLSCFPWPGTEAQLIVRDVVGNPGNPVSRLVEVTALLHGYL
jgi:hypothetical protein